MTNNNRLTQPATTDASRVSQINQQIATDAHYPFNLQSGWLPAPNSPTLALFFERVLSPSDSSYAPSVQALDDFISGNPVVSYLMDNACQQNENLVTAFQQIAAAEQVTLPRISSKDDLLNGFNNILSQPPTFINDELVGLPFSALVVGIDPTLSGVTLFGLPQFNEKMSAILNDWNSFLASSASNWVFAVDGQQWLSPAAKQQYQFEVWQKDNETLPYWNSWNSFFTRQFKDQQASRPVNAPTSNQIVVSANDGSLFRWDDHIAATDVFWFKDMAYSLTDILSSPIAEQQALLDEYNLVDRFTDGSIFQTYLNPYNFHRWWCPVNGDVLFNPVTVPGCYFNKLVIPDFGGATTASLPYLVQVNARGIMVIKTPDYGYVCCIPLGMSEVSTIAFNSQMQAQQPVKKGQEMGMFEYGGSSYVMIFQSLPGKKLFFQSGSGQVYDKRPVLPKGSADTGGNVTLIGAQIGIWQNVATNVSATLPWQNAGYINEGCQYSISYQSGLWTANPNINNGNLYDANGSSIIATQSGYPLIGAPEGALIGRIGNNPPFLIGDNALTPQGQTGQLQLTINDDLNGQYGPGLTDNVGQVILSITPAQ
jgi:phosphatidylserine decarboxylase